MYSIKFPDMLSSAKTNLVEDKAATYNNLYLLLKSSQNSLLGDPAFGTRLDSTIYSHTALIKDLVVDNIYSSIRTFIPQLSVDRSNIRVLSSGTRLLGSIKGTNIKDKTVSMYDIGLTSDFTSE